MAARGGHWTKGGGFQASGQLSAAGAGALGNWNKSRLDSAQRSLNSLSDKELDKRYSVTERQYSKALADRARYTSAGRPVPARLARGISNLDVRMDQLITALDRYM